MSLKAFHKMNNEHHIIYTIFFYEIFVKNPSVVSILFYDNRLISKLYLRENSLCSAIEKPALEASRCSFAGRTLESKFIRCASNTEFAEKYCHFINYN